MRICVVGLGKIGLPLAAQYASKGHVVVGCDVNQGVVDSINKGVSHVKGEPGLSDKVSKAVEKKLLSASTETSKVVAKSDVVVVIVPLVVDEKKKRDYAIIDSATRDVAKGLKKDTLVIYETTLPVGDTRERIAPMLEKSGLKAGKDFYLVYSPERISSGVAFKYLKEIPKIVGGVNEKSTNMGVEFYKQVLDCEIIPVRNCETAEAVKLFDMVYRDVNIALANEFAKFCQLKRLDVLEIVSSANTNPHSNILRPGAGVGGHCTPVYPYFLIENASKLGVDLILPKNARLINDGMPDYAVNLLQKELKGLSGKRILVLGLAFRGDVKETWFSPAVPLIKKLKDAKAKVFLHDPLFTEEELKNFAEPASLKKPPKLDGAILVTAHKEYSNLDLNALKACGLKVFVDGRNLLEKKLFDSLGITYRGIGRY